MKKLNVQPTSGVIYLNIEVAKAGALDTSSRKSAVEYAEVLAVGDGITNIKVGDHVFVKAWAVDIINHNDETYYFVNIETKGILAIVK